MKRTLVISCLALVLAVAQGASADTITLQVGAGGTAGDLIIGEVIPTTVGGGGQAARDAAMLTTLIGMSLGTRTGAGISPEYYRSTTDFGALPAVDASTAVLGSMSNSSITFSGNYAVITLAAGTAYQYLIAAWDGQNGGAEAWYIGNVAAGSTIYVPRYAYPSPSSGTPPDPAAVWPQNLVDGASEQQYGMTTWTLFNPASVPDGGATATLLGLAMAGLGLVRRFKG